MGWEARGRKGLGIGRGEKGRTSRIFVNSLAYQHLANTLA